MKIAFLWDFLVLKSLNIFPLIKKYPLIKELLIDISRRLTIWGNDPFSTAAMLMYKLPNFAAI